MFLKLTIKSNDNFFILDEQKRQTLKHYFLVNCQVWYVGWHNKKLERF